MTQKPRIILHVDMDSFYASIEVREHPELKGRAVIIGADPKGGAGRGVVSTCSYEARKYGVHSAMPISTAYHLCPSGVYLPVNFPLYAEVSARIMAILSRFADQFQQVSIDEAFLDITSLGSYSAAKKRAELIKATIREHEGLTCSIGIAPSRVVAKIASDYQKPDGITIVEPSEVDTFLSPMPVGRIPGIGKKAQKALEEMGISTIGQLAAYDIQALITRFGKWAISMHELAHARDTGAVPRTYHRKSISRELTFAKDTDEVPLIRQAMDAMAEDVHKTLVKNGFSFRTITIKVRFSGFYTHTKSRSISHPCRDLAVLRSLSWSLIEEFLGGEKIRLIGIRLSKFEHEGSCQMTLNDFSS
jgi:DNA polymerase IV (DinB-like DNA polymerase)